MQLCIDGEIALDGQGATHTLTAAGSRLVLRSERPLDLIEAVGTAAGGLSVVSRTLSAAGLRLVITGPDGDIATLGSGVRSTVGRLLVGVEGVQPGRLRAALPLLRAQSVRPTVQRWLVAAAGIGLVATVARRTLRRR